MSVVATDGINPVSALKPVAIVPTNNYAVRVILGAETVSKEQLSAAITYLNEQWGGTFKLIQENEGEPFVLDGNTLEYYRDVEEAMHATLKPTYRKTGQLTIKVARYNRVMIGVECTLKLVEREPHQIIPELSDEPAELGEFMRSRDGWSEVIFTLADPTRNEQELIDDAVRVANAFGVYILHRPTNVADADRIAGLYPQFRYGAPVA